MIKSINSQSDNEEEEFVFFSMLIFKIVESDFNDFINSYKCFFNQIMEEQILFMNSKKYSRDNFREVYENLYNNDTEMSLYLKVLLISQMLWSNHAKSIISFKKFININKKKLNFLEIGAGHGLYTFLACKNDLINKVSVWDVSRESLR